MKRNNMSLRLGAVLSGLLVLILVLAGCSSGTTSAVPATTTPAAASGISGTVTESGSTTVQPLAEKLAEAFMTANSGAKVIIQGGGSSVGIKAAKDGTVDIGAASRDVTAEESAGLSLHVLAKDGIAIVVNPANGINGLTKAQVRDIFAGKITKWSEVGGADKNIHVAAREEGSGTRAAFEEMVMGKDAVITKSAILQSSNGALVQVVKSDADAVSFVSFGYLVGDVKALSIDGIAATVENARNGSYPVVRPLLFVTKSETSAITRAFLDYCTGPGAQAIISGEGYITVK